jgi:hypothetical protein
MRALHSKAPAIIYSLEPWPQRGRKAKARLYAYEVLGQSALSESQKATAVGAFDAAVAGWDGLMAACFDPRVAIRTQSDGQTYDVLLCYECHQIEVFREGKRVGSAGAAGSPKVLNDLLASLHLPLSHSLEDMLKVQQAERILFDEGKKRFLATMPPSIRPFWDADEELRMGTLPSGKQMEDIRAAFRAANPGQAEAVRTLLVWYGSGVGRWSGYAGYEQLAGDLLSDYPVALVIAAAEAPDASDALLEGAARHFAMGKDASLLPASLKQRLLEHTLNSGATNEQDRRNRAKHAFSR